MIDSTMGFVISTISKSVSAILHTKLRMIKKARRMESTMIRSCFREERRIASGLAALRLDWESGFDPARTTERFGSFRERRSRDG